MALKHFPWEYYMKLCHAGPHLGLFRGPLGPCRPLKRPQGGPAHYRTVWCGHISVEFLRVYQIIMHCEINILKFLSRWTIIKNTKSSCISREFLQVHQISITSDVPNEDKVVTATACLFKNLRLDIFRSPCAIS